MIYKNKNYDSLYGTPGFSDGLLKNHFTLYQGYVKKTNELIERIGKYHREESESNPEYMELKRRFGWEFNGMRLHEYYFENMKKEHDELESGTLKEKIESDFGSFELWQKDFITTGAMRGIGWVILAYDLVGDRLLNFWINEHDLGHGAGVVPLLVMDVFEHAYIQDYGLKKEEYIRAFFQAINWQEVSKRFQDSTVMIHHAHS